MDVILLKSIDNLGDKHDVVTVKNGYGRNYLIPQKAAIIANNTNMAKLDKIREAEEAQMAKRIDEFKAMAAKLEGQVVKIGAKAGSGGKIFGSVTSIQIAQALKEQFDMDVDRKMIILDDDIKNLGSYTATIKFHKDFTAPVNFEVIQD